MGRKKKKFYIINDKSIIYNIKKKGCWNCISHSKDSDGYPHFTKNKRCMKVSRYIYKLYYPKFNINNPKKFVLHKCDNRLCINPNHLYEGTHKDNMIDMVKRNRQVKGENHGSAKLTEKQVKEIMKSTLSSRVLGKKYSVDKIQILSIKNRLTWKHVKGKRVKPKYHIKKLSEKDVIKIFKSPKSYIELSKEYNVCYKTIWFIKNKKTWKSIIMPYLKQQKEMIKDV